MKNAQTIINDARFELVTHIVTLMRMIDAYNATGDKKLATVIDPEEGVIIGDYDLVSVPCIRVEVAMPYVDTEDRVFEHQEIESISTTDDHYFTVSVGGAEVGADDISTDDLLVIAKCLEETYNAE